MNTIEASILVINYNNERYIAQCIKSILNQSINKNLEIIFHDDNSTDDSIKIVKKTKNIKIIKNKKKTSYGSFNQMEAIKRSLVYSKGEIVFLLDSDDYFTKNKVKIILELFKKENSLDIIYDLPILKKGNNFKNIKLRNKNFQRFWSYIPPQSCISIRRKVLKKIISKINIKKYPDVWIDFRIAIYARYILKHFYVLEKNLTVYRKINSSASHKFRKFSRIWWNRRYQAHNFIKYFFKINKIKYKKNLDYFLTLIVNKIIK